jgi:DNA-binding transcriptional MocR family regulator
MPLRESVAKWLSSIYHGPITSERICITNGASGNLDNILARFTEPGYTRNIWMIEPSYFLACPIFMDAGFDGQLRGIPEDEEGLDIHFLREALEESERNATQQEPKLKTGPRYEKMYKHIIYGVPTFSNPSGRTMSLRRRIELVRLARRFDALVITDDVYDILRWPEQEEANVADLGAVPPRIVDLDRTLDGGPKDTFGNATSNGSFSKIIAPGMRVGWAEGTPAFALALSQVGSTRSGGCPTHISASFVYEMLESGSLQTYLSETVIPTFRERYYAMMKAIDALLIPLGFEKSSGKSFEVTTETNGIAHGHANGHGSDYKETIPEAGGYFIYLMLPSHLSNKASELAARGLERYDLKFAYGDMFQVQGDINGPKRAAQGFGKGIRLSWAWHTKVEIVEGIRRLAQLTQDTSSTL